MAESAFSPRYIFPILRRRKWIIISVSIVVGTFSYWLSVTPAALYQAESVVKISRAAANMQALLLETLSWTEGDNIATQSAIITSQKIKARVALRLAPNYPEFQDVTSLLADEQELDYDVLEQTVGNNPQLARLISGISVEPQRKGQSDIVGIQSTASSAALAIDTANYTAEEFVNYNIAERNREISQAVQFIQARTLETEQQLREAEERLEVFEGDHAETLSLDVGEAGGLSEQIESLAREGAKLEESIVQVEAITHVDQYFAFSPALREVEDSQISPLEQQVLQLILQISQSRRERNELLSYLTEESREVQRNALQTEQLTKSAEELVASLLQRYGALRDELEEQRSGLVERHNRLVEVPELVRQLESLQSQVALEREARNLLQRRLQDAEIQEAGEIQEISLIQRATSAAASPQTPRLLKALIGLMIGAILGGVIALILGSRGRSMGAPLREHP